jgi:two-component system response regulator CpxR
MLHCNVTPSILIVDDDVVLCSLLRGYLELEGFIVAVVHSAECAIERLRDASDRISLVLLDVMMPGRDGFAILRQLRTISRVPIIILSGLKEPTDRILGLELGADDYIGKPFLPAEVAARIRANVRKSSSLPPTVIRVGELRVLPMARRAFVLDREIRLTAAEFAILLTLATRFGTATEREMLRPGAFGRLSDRPDRRVDVHVSRLRAKLAAASPGAPRIASVRHCGYELHVPTASEPTFAEAVYATRQIA